MSIADKLSSYADENNQEFDLKKVIKEAHRDGEKRINELLNRVE